MQRGIYDPFWRDITWETIRERAYSTPDQIQVSSASSSQWETVAEPAYVTPEKLRFVRKRSSRFDQWTHALRLRRTRMSDKAG